MIAFAVGWAGNGAFPPPLWYCIHTNQGANVQQVTVPNLALSNIEYLCLKMHANPGLPARWYLRALRQYRFGTPGDGSWNVGYFSPRGIYRGHLFNDEAPKDRAANGWFTKRQSSKGSFHLTARGHTYAQRAAAKIGAVL